MKLSLLSTLVLSLVLTESIGYAATALKTDTDKLSYTMGNSIGANLRKQEITVNAKVLQQGLEDGLSEAKPLLTPAEQKSALENLQAQIVEKKSLAGRKFLAANAKKAGVITTKSGLQYKKITTGTGPKPTNTAMVTVDYEGRLIDGKVFDSSYARGKPTTFAVNAVIPGWTEGLQLMPVGSTWIFYIPADLAYGAADVGGIGPEQVLEFKVHLISTEAAKPAKKITPKK